MISTSNVSVQFGKRILFVQVNTTFKKGTCYGIIGANVSGKSTFLKIISGKLSLNSGNVITEPNKRLSVLEQNQNEFDEYETLKTTIMGNKIDYGIKKNIVRYFSNFNCEVIVVPCRLEAEDIIKLKPDGIFLSNGPGDPAATGKYAINIIQKLIKTNIPIFGICLGHQLLALALKAKTKKMKLGHRGANHPVKNLINSKVEITSQNHGFEVVKESLPKNVEMTHKSLFDNSVEGIKLKNKPVFSVQYHPESNPGPQDSHYLFNQFINLVKKNAKKKRY